MTRVATTMVCPCVCDNHHYNQKEEERLVMTTVTGDTMALGEGSHYDTTTRKTAMVTTMQDRLQQRSDRREPTTSLDYIIRQTDWLRLKLLAFFSQLCLSDLCPRRSGLQRLKHPLIKKRIHGTNAAHTTREWMGTRVGSSQNRLFQAWLFALFTRRRSFAPFCVFVFALFCARFCMWVFLRPTAFRTTTFGNSRNLRRRNTATPLPAPPQKTRSTSLALPSLYGNV